MAVESSWWMTPREAEAARDLHATEVEAVRLAREAAPSPVADRLWPTDVAVDRVRALRLLVAVAPVVPRRGS